MQWWMRPGPSRCWAIMKPVALAAEQRVGGHAHVLVEDLGVAAELAEARPRGCSIVGTSRRMFTPGVSAGTMNIDARWCGRASGSVTAMTIRKSAIDALVENHLCPLMTYSSPSRTARVCSGVGSEPACPARSSRTPTCRSPASSGCSQRSFCSGVPASARISLLPESGAWLPNAFGANGAGAEDLVHQPELDLAEALAAELGSRCAAHSPRSLTCSCSGA